MKVVVSPSSVFSPSMTSLDIQDIEVLPSPFGKAELCPASMKEANGSDNLLLYFCVNSFWDSSRLGL